MGFKNVGILLFIPGQIFVYHISQMERAVPKELHLKVFLIFFQPISFRAVSQIIDMVKKNKMYVTCFCSFTQNIGFLIDDWYTMGFPWKTFCALIEWIQLP